MEVRNKKLILKDYACGFPKESDMKVITSERINLKLSEDSKGVLVKNLFLAADPHLRPLMKKADNFSVLQSFNPGSVLPRRHRHIFRASWRQNARCSSCKHESARPNRCVWDDISVHT